MINKEVAALMNKQINMELYSAYVYVNIANFFIDENLNGYGHWFNMQAIEEKEHAYRFMEFLQDLEVKIELEDIKAYTKEYSKPIDALEEFLAHEKEITTAIYKIVDKSREVNDYRALRFLDWFIDEQTEEEVTAIGMIDDFNTFGNCAGGLLKLDRQCAKREE